jgi:1-acyl-sn-glycerol-3-phosphate acyltransferase
VLPRAGRLGLVLQRQVSRLLGPLWMVLATGLLRFGRGYRIERVADTRRQYRQIRRGEAAPLLICANHLTLIDSALIASALGSPWWYLLRFSAMPWNMPERTNFAFSWPAQMLAYVMKCLPITRGGPREEVAATLQRFVAVLANGDAGLVFPEGGRSRSGRIDEGAVTYGIGRIVRALPGCRVLCVYLRGAQQTNFSDLPARGDRFHVELKLIEPQSAANGLRADRDIARQIVAQLAEMEQRYFNGRQ